MVSYKKYLDIEVFEGELSNHQYPWHYHTCYTIILVEKGLIIYEFENQKVEVYEKEVFIIEPFLIHRNKISQQTIYTAIFLPNEYLEFKGKNKILTQIIRFQNIVDWFIGLLHKIKQNEHNKAVCTSLVELQAFIEKIPQKHIFDSQSHRKIIPEIDCDLSINELSKKAHMSKFHFQRKFKQYNGLTVGQLKQQEKTIRAKILLEKGKLSTDVAHELGFFDQSHFIKYFKKMWATTPKNFK